MYPNLNQYFHYRLFEATDAPTDSNTLQPYLPQQAKDISARRTTREAEQRSK
jgi:hypothetical protein